jgi:DNA helicase HerA-like ATPase
MEKVQSFRERINQGYACKGEHIVIGTAMLEGACSPDMPIRIPLATLNRHGLIAGATGTGKTKTLQMLAEELSRSSVPVLLMDLKGDLSGMARAGVLTPSIEERQKKSGLPWKPEAFPVEFFTISGEKGVRMRATTSEFGPVLLSRILGLNDTQSGVMALIFKYCDDKKLPLLDIKDLKKVLQFITNEGKKEVEDEFGKVSTASTGTILRKIIELEQQGAEQFFGEKSFEVDDLLHIDDKGYGVVSMIRLTDMQSHPKLFSTFMLSLLGEIYHSFPEEGDLTQPKLCIFIDEAHLIFEEATKALLDQIETIIKLIRSKGVGIYFCTQSPADVPSSILAQLGLKIQHALRAFTAADRKSIKLAAENYPVSEFYKTDELLTSLGIGEALVTVLDEKGVPTPLSATFMRTPATRMGTLTTQELDETLMRSRLKDKYNQAIDRESAYEMLAKKIEELHKPQQAPAAKPAAAAGAKGAAHQEKGVADAIFDNPLVKQVGRSVTSAVAREVTRGILGVLGLGGKPRRR